MRVKDLISYSKQLKMNCLFLPTCFKGKYKDRLREVRQTSYISVLGLKRLRYTDLREVHPNRNPHHALA